jgi:GH15 family glucan-1,4-alpha-glucosidase
MDLYARSIEIILANQHSSGAYVASPNFPTYRYAWFRDGSFVAYAMDLAGEHASAGRFHAWAAQAILRRAAVVRRALAKAAAGQPLTEADVLHTRLTLEGEDGRQDGWGNFQLDGFGTWLWSLDQHLRLAGNVTTEVVAPKGEWLSAARLAAGYLAGLWARPNYDCWEEFPDHVHPHTLAAIYGGLAAYEEIESREARVESGESREEHRKPGDESREARIKSREARQAIKSYIEAHFVHAGHFVKFPGQPGVDASLLGLALPYGVFEPSDPRLAATVAEIERTLRQGASGVRRYARDTYYGGGEWVLLAAWLGWYHAACAGQPGSREKAAGLLEWVEAQADPQGSLPEQVPAHLNSAKDYAPWLKRWGPIATPLLWSHAKHIILRNALKD